MTPRGRPRVAVDIAAVLEQIEAGTTPTEIARRNGVSRGVLYKLPTIRAAILGRRHKLPGNVCPACGAVIVPVVGAVR